MNCAVLAKPDCRALRGIIMLDNCFSPVYNVNTDIGYPVDEQLCGLHATILSSCLSLTKIFPTGTPSIINNTNNKNQRYN